MVMDGLINVTFAQNKKEQKEKKKKKKQNQWLQNGLKFD